MRKNLFFIFEKDKLLDIFHANTDTWPGAACGEFQKLLQMSLPHPCKFFYLIENSKIFFHTDVHEIQQLRIGFLCSVGFSYFFTTPSFLKHLFANPSPLFITIYMYLYVLHVFV